MLILGIVIGFYVEIPILFVLILMFVLLPVLYWASKSQKRDGFPFFELTSITITLCLGMLVVGLSTCNDFGYVSTEQTLNSERLWHVKIKEVLKPNPYTQRYVAKVIALDKKESSGTILLSHSLDSTGKKLNVDDELLFIDKAEPISPSLNPHQFDYRDYLKKQGIRYQVKTNFESVIIKDNAAKTWVGLAHRLRNHIISKLRQQNFGPEELAVIQALLLGQRDDISEDTYNNYKNAGAVHILAVSGLHVGILLLILEFLLIPLERLKNGRTLKLILVVGLLWSYAFIAGLSPSIVRAVTMFSFLAYAMYLNRPTNSFNIIALSIFFILLIKPLFLFQVGFQMSYAAVIAIVWVYPKLQKFWYPDNFLVRKTWQLLSVSVAAQLGVLPISLYYFHQFPALFFVSNLLIIPFLGLILGIGLLIITLSLVDLLPNFLVVAYNKIIQLMNWIIAWVAQQEGFIIKDIPFDSVQMILAYVFIFFLVTFLSKPNKRMVFILFVVPIGFQGWVLWNQTQLQDKENFILMHKSRNTVLFHQTGRVLNVLTSDTTLIGNLSANFSVAERIQKTSFEPIRNSYKLGQKRLYVMDSLALFPLERHADYLLLTKSPKINLERLLDSVQPKMVLADGSNYKSVVILWKQTCAQKEIPFHYTGEKGAFYFE